MRLTLLLHVLAGSLGIVSGFVALFVAKGARAHRRAGLLFVGTMLVMCAGGVWLAVATNTAPAINIPAGLLTAYLVVTALTTVTPPASGGRALHVAAMLVALAVGLVSVGVGGQAVAAGGRRAGIAVPLFMFGAIALLAAAGDARRLRGPSLTGSARLARHLWRMCAALAIASMAFFLGQADEFPAALRIRPLLATPVLTVLGAMVYWLWRMRPRRAARRLVSVAAHSA